MSGAPTNGGTTSGPGAASGIDDGPTTRATGQARRAARPQPSDLQVLPDDAVHGDPDLIECLRQAARGHPQNIDGVPVDATTAAAILTVYQAATPTTRARLAQLHPNRMAGVCWRILRPHL